MQLVNVTLSVISVYSLDILGDSVTPRMGEYVCVLQ